MRRQKSDIKKEDKEAPKINNIRIRGGDAEADSELCMLKFVAMRS